MVDWKYFLFAQFPAFFLLAVFFLISYLRVRQTSAVKSVLWVLLFGVALACSVLFVFLGVNQKYWTLKTLFPLGFASWIGVILVVVAVIVHVVHTIEKKHNRKVMEKELEKAAKDKETAVAQAREEAAQAARQAHEDGRRAALGEAEAARFSDAAVAAGAEAAASELASAVQAPIELTLAAGAPEPPAASPEPLVEPSAFDPMTGQPLGGAPGQQA